MRQLQHFADMFGDVAELQVTMRLARAGQGADNRSQAAAVDEDHLAEMQDNRAAVAQQMGDVGAQGFSLAAGNDASFAADDGDASDLAGFKYQPQKCVSSRHRV